MSRLSKKLANRRLRALRVRARVSGTTERPRLVVRISNLHVSAQIIDDVTHKTLVYATTVGAKATGSKTELAAAIGKQIAEKAKKVKVTQVVLDRGAKLYHGRVKALADAARAEGLEF